jgi:hypothetical protein
VQPLLVVILLDENFNVGTQVLEIFIRVRVNFFPLQRLDEALATGVA